MQPALRSILTAVLALILAMEPAAVEAKKPARHAESAQTEAIDVRRQPSTDYRTTPLMIIRFNQRKVYYERPLYEAVRQAVEAKPGVRFALQSRVPAGQEEAAGRNLDRVYRTLTEMGVPASRIAVESNQDAAISDSEVHIFVK